MIEAGKLIAEMPEEEINALFDTGAFNNICKGYLKEALKNSGLSDEKQAEIKDQFADQFDFMDAAGDRKVYRSNFS